MTAISFNARTVEPASTMDPVPTDWYKCVITNSEVKPTSKNDGHYINFEIQIIEGQFAKRKGFDKVNIDNPNPVAVEIGYRTLSAICHATNVLDLQDTTQLHNIPLMVKFSLRPAGLGADNKHYEATNEIKGYKAVGGAGAETNWSGSQQAVSGPGWQQPSHPPSPGMQQPAPQAYQAPQPSPAPVQPQAAQAAPWAQQAAPQPVPQQAAPQQAPAPWAAQQAAAPQMQPSPAPSAPPQQMAPAPAAGVNGAIPPWAQQPQG